MQAYGGKAFLSEINFFRLRENSLGHTYAADFASKNPMAFGRRN
jgi:hypothetical protein